MPKRTPTPTGSAPKTICPPPSVGGHNKLCELQKSNYQVYRHELVATKKLVVWEVSKNGLLKLDKI